MIMGRIIGIGSTALSVNLIVDAVQQIVEKLSAIKVVVEIFYKIVSEEAEKIFKEAIDLYRELDYAR